MARTKVAIYGAGVGGLSVAHELAKRADLFDVVVYESNDWIGGKARSQFVKLGPSGGPPLPGEHGFRFFPAFYSHLDQTLSEVPTASGGTVLENLVPSREFAVARAGRRPVVASRRLQSDLAAPGQWRSLLSAWYSDGGLDLSSADLAALSGAVLRFMASSETRRAVQFDQMSWQEFAAWSSESVSDSFRELNSALPRTMVAMDGRRGSAYTIGKILCQLAVLDPLRTPPRADRVLNGPTDDVWLRPWYRHLRKAGVRFFFNTAVERFVLDDSKGSPKVALAELSHGGVVRADYHLCAMPLDRLSRVIDDPMALASNSLRQVRRGLRGHYDWMVGAQYFLRRPLSVAHGHVVYVDSPWALTSVSQEQFWSREHLGPLQAQGVRGLVSVDISDWDAVAPRLGRAARDCTRDEILDEVFSQISESLQRLQPHPLNANEVVHRHLDRNIRFRRPGERASSNRTPLFVHRPGAFRFRPSAQTELPNLLIASDFVSTFTNLASMEGANEAGRRAARRIIAREAPRMPLPFVRQLQEPEILRPVRILDGWLMARHPDAPEALAQNELDLSEIAEEALGNGALPLGRAKTWLRSAQHGRPDHLSRIRSALDRATRRATRHSGLGFPRRRPASIKRSRTAESDIARGRLGQRQVERRHSRGPL